MADTATNIDIETQEDGSVVVSLEQHRAARDDQATTTGHNANLASTIDHTVLTSIADDLLRGIDADEASRTQWVNNYNEGLKLLSILLETPGQSDKTSRVRSVLLLWAIVKFQSQARGELLPTTGPCKIRNDAPGRIPDEVAQAIEDDENHYLTVTASEYVPDTDRGLFYLGYGGTIFKKVYNCPLRERTVSECVYLPDLIISNDATDMRNASRVTHVVQMSTSQIQQMMDVGYFDPDVQLSQPAPRPTSTQTATGQVIGINVVPARPEDVPHTLCECYCTLDLGHYAEGLREKDQRPGIALPYRVTIDRYSRQIYEMRRNWREGGKRRDARRRFGKWGLVPGIGYLDLGYLNLLGNHALANTALTRILVDSGIYANIPAGLRIKGVRQETNEIRPGPGEFPEIDTGGLPIQQAVMALPYKGPDPVLLQFLQYLDAQGEKVAGQVELPTGQGRTNIPVGTMLAMIEQDTQIVVSVHQRLHTAQQEELEMIRECQAELATEYGEEHFWDLMGYDGDETPPYTMEQFTSAKLVPASDPNTPAFVHRVMQSTAIELLSQRHPEMYNQYEVQKTLLKTLKVPNIDTILIPPQPPAPPPPDPTMAIASMQADIERQRLQLDAADQQGRQRLDQMKLFVDSHMQTVKAQQAAEAAKAKAAAEAQAEAARQRLAAQDSAAEQEAEAAEQFRLGQEAARAAIGEMRERELDRESKERIAAMADHTTLVVKGMEALADPQSISTKEDK